MFWFILSSLLVALPPTPGCTDPEASNYDALASVDDGSCTYPCTSPELDGYTYAVTAIGSACWFAENLRTTKFANGETIPETVTNLEWKGNTSTLRRAPYGHNADSLASVGYHYSGWAVFDERGVCPTGWRPPSMEDFQAVALSLGLPAADTSAMRSNLATVGVDEGVGTQMKLPGIGGTNSSGFGAKSSGRSHGANGTFNFPTTATYFTTTQDPLDALDPLCELDPQCIWETSEFLRIELTSATSGIVIGRNRLKYGTALRCVRIAPSPPPAVVGCMEVEACNFDASASVAGSCSYAETGYDCDGVCLNDSDADGVCDEFEVAGCQDATACNYNENATDEDSTCIYASGCDACSGETDGTGIALDGDADGDQVCDADEVVGCVDAVACNYNPSATDAGDCDYTCIGCMDPNACNFSSGATVEGDCHYLVFNGFSEVRAASGSGQADGIVLPNISGTGGSGTYRLVVVESAAQGVPAQSKVYRFSSSALPGSAFESDDWDALLPGRYRFALRDDAGCAAASEHEVVVPAQ